MLLTQAKHPRRRGLLRGGSGVELDRGGARLGLAGGLSAPRAVRAAGSARALSAEGPARERGNGLRLRGGARRAGDRARGQDLAADDGPGGGAVRARGDAPG